ncbi:hypothetical protein ABK040_001008 [Willaertia magna]
MLRDLIASDKGGETLTSNSNNIGSSSGSSSFNNPLNNAINSNFRAIQQQEDFYTINNDNMMNNNNLLNNNQQQFQQISPFQHSSGLLSQYTPMERNKIRERSEMISRHLNPTSMNQGFQESNFTNSRGFSNSSSMGQFNSRMMNNEQSSFGQAISNFGQLEFQGDDDVTNLESHSLENYLSLLQQQLQNIGNTVAPESLEMLHDPYEFLTTEQNNPYLTHTDHQYQNLYEVAKNILISKNQNHTTTSTEQAILALEAQLILQPNHADAWYLLGQCHAECDDDNRAISCYAEAVRSDENHLDALVNLGVSYTNELHKHAALSYLRKWITNHPVYGNVIKDVAYQQDEENEYMSTTMVDFYQRHAKLRQLFEKAVELSPTKDSKLHMALGVLYHLVNNFDASIQQFKAACQVDPTNYSLWNKLGATHANAKKPQLAIECYRKALNLKPDYVRAWVNLGIAYSNQGDFNNAAKFYLRSLKLSPRNNHVWYYLTYDFNCLKRKDLVEKCKTKNVELFRNDFQF